MIRKNTVNCLSYYSAHATWFSDHMQYDNVYKKHSDPV